MQFFNFGNNETYHFFTWATEAGYWNPDDLIGMAYELAEQPNEFELAIETDICETVLIRLANLMRDGLYEHFAPHLDADMETKFSIGQVGQEGVTAGDQLIMPLLAHALNRIDFFAVALALLIRAGKWTPSKEPPEMN